MSTLSTPPRSGPGRTPQASSTLTPRIAWRIAALGFGALGLLALLLVRLWFLQVIGSEGYAERADVNRLRTVVTPPARGLITDRNGAVLVGNRPSTNIVARPRELTGARRERVLRRLAPLLGVSYASLAQTVEAGVNTPYQSVTIAENVPNELAVALQERPRQFPGIAVAESYVRDYRQTADHRPHAASVLGYTGAITAENVQAYRDKGYAGNERVGVAGLESEYEPFLRGIPGELKVEVDAQGEPVGRGVVSSVAPQPGGNLELSIDLPTQEAMEDALRTYTALNGYAEGAAGVALDPRTGEILAIASFPSFDPGAFTENRPKDIQRLYDDELQPLFNRVTDGEYPAASTFKVVTGTAALEEGVITPDTPIESRGVMEFYGQDFKNYGEQWHGWITMPKALEVSSDTFFDQISDEFYKRSDTPLQKWATTFGFGEPTGVDLPGESAGIVPTKAWKEKTYAGPDYNDGDRDWRPGDTIQMGIGQGYLRVTPLQLARAYAAIANGGTLYTPTIGRRILSPGGKVLRNLVAERKSTRLPVSESTLATLQQGLYQAANGPQGTSTAVFGGLPADARVAGKTGTAEVPPKEDDSLWVGYAPASDPRIVVAIVIEHAGTGANAAAPAACEVITANLGVDPNLCGTSQTSGAH